MLLPENGRLRIASDLIVSDSTATGSNGATFHGAGLDRQWTTYSKMYDFPRGRFSLFQGVVRPIEQLSMKSLHGIIRAVPFTGGGGVVITPITGGSIVSPDILASLVPAVSESVWWELSRDAFDALSDQFPAELSLGNFLLELDDLAAIIPKLEKTISKTLASLFLNVEFNLKPTLKDLGALFNLCASCSSRIDYLRKTRGKPTPVHHLKNDVTESPNIILYDDGPGGAMIEYRFREWRSEFRAGASLSQNLTHLDDFYGLLRAYMGKTGLNNPLGIVWNAIPFSFVLDWFVPVSSYLKRFKVQGADGQWDLNNLTSSVIQSCRIEITQVDRVNGQRSQIGEVDFRRFVRVVGLPVPLLLLPSIQALSSKQLSLLLAMST